MLPAIPEGFSPRNGEVILKTVLNYNQLVSERFQSPQWGSNSKVIHIPHWYFGDWVSVPAMGK